MKPFLVVPLFALADAVGSAEARDPGFACAGVTPGVEGAASLSVAAVVGRGSGIIAPGSTTMGGSVLVVGS